MQTEDARVQTGGLHTGERLVCWQGLQLNPWME